MTKKNAPYIHVIPHKDSWVVRSESNKKVTSVHDTQREAIDVARKTAQTVKGELVIHARDGRIRERDSYGSDPLPPKSPREVLFPIARSKTSELEIRKAVREVIQETRDGTLNGL
jgi:hypothetical protein